MRYLISGASSSLARAIAQELLGRGHERTLVGRKSQPTFDFSNLEKNLPELFENYDVFLHLAHSFEKQATPDLNQNAADVIINCLDQPSSRIRKCIFISSESASALARSQYGKSKYRTEQVFLKSKRSTILRVGIIQDANIDSPYHKLKNFVKKTGVLVFPRLKSKIFTVTTVNGICDNIEKIVAMDLTGGPFCNQNPNFKKSILEVLEDDKIEMRIVFNIPTKVIETFIHGGKRFRSIRRVADSLASVLTDPETCQEIPESEPIK